jgi:hypothetical protein
MAVIKAKVVAREPTAAELNIALKKLQLKKNEMEFAVRHDELCSRAEVTRQWLKNAAEVRNIFINLPSRIRQALRLTLDQQGEIEAVVDSVMSENLNRHDDETPAKPKRVRRKPAAA